MRRGCYDQREVYRPQWAYSTPKGFHDEEWIMGPFPLVVPGTGALALNLPAQLDDDVPFYIRAIMIDSTLGTSEQDFPPQPFFAGALVRIRDTYGNPLTAAGVNQTGAAVDDLVLGLGVWANQQNGLNAFGFVVEPEVECSPGGSIIFDILAPTTGAAATFFDTIGPESIEFVAAVMGTAGNAFTIQLIDPGAPGVPLSVAVVGGVRVQVTLATNGASVITTTFAELQAIINATPAVLALMYALIFGPTPDAVVTALAETPLGGGSLGASFTYNGTFIGVKRFPDCL